MARFHVLPMGERGGEIDGDGWPLFGVRDWTFTYLIARGQASTLSLDVESSPIDAASEDEEWAKVKDLVDETDPATPAKGEVEVRFDPGEQFFRVAGDAGAAGDDWHFRVIAEANIFDPENTEHTDLLEPQTRTSSTLKKLAERAEKQVLNRFTDGGTLMLRVNTDLGDALRRAIAARVDWLYRRRVLHLNDSDRDELGDLQRSEWRDAESALSRHDLRPVVYGL